MDDLPADTDICLRHAHAQWQPALQQGIQAMEAQDYRAAQAAFSEAIRLSAAYHPLFHFLEAGLNTECATLHLRAGEYATAERLFARAVFLHHDNATALQGKAAVLAQDSMAALPPYGMDALAQELAPPQVEPGIHLLLRDARAAASTALYEQAIAACEATHMAYHQAAAVPWLCRAECFAAQGEDLLARNDIRRGMDLDRKNAELLALSLSLAA